MFAEEVLRSEKGRCARARGENILRGKLSCTCKPVIVKFFPELASE